jgi:hypothetical protein
MMSGSWITRARWRRAAARRPTAAREAVTAAGEPHALQQGTRPRHAVRVGAAVEVERQQEVLLHGQEWDEVEELKDEACVPAAEARARLLVERREVGAVHGHAPGRGPVDARDQVQQRGLPGAAAADEHDDLAAADRK